MSARFFVTGTDTGVGKTQVSGALLSLLAARGERPFAFKPYESGVEARPADADFLQHCAGGWQSLESVCLHRFRQPLAPGVAARLAGRKSVWAATAEAFRALGRGPGIVEGAGGLFVPLDDTHDVIDLIRALKLPVVLVARAGLGTLNHTALSLEALAARTVKVAAIVVVRTVARRDASEAYNVQWLRERHRAVRVLGPVPYVKSAEARARAFEKVVSPLL